MSTSTIRSMLYHQPLRVNSPNNSVLLRITDNNALWVSGDACIWRLVITPGDSYSGATYTILDMDKDRLRNINV